MEPLMPAGAAGRSDGGSMVVCLPPSGAGRSFFRQWPREIGGAQVIPLSRPGHEERAREPAARSMDQAAAAVVDRIVGQVPARVVLFGHSLGGAVAFEAARLLSPHDIALSLVVSARQAPHLPSSAVDLVAADDITLLETLAHWGGAALSDPDDPVAVLLLPALRADFELSAEYTWNGRLASVPLITVSYREDAVVAEASVRAWEKVTEGHYRHVTEPGDHFAARTPSPGLIRILTEALACVHRPGPRLRTVRHRDTAATEGAE